jgi:hypothetical protein
MSITLIEEGISVIIEGLLKFLNKVSDFIYDMLSLYRLNNLVTY